MFSIRRFSQKRFVCLFDYLLGEKYSTTILKNMMRNKMIQEYRNVINKSIILVIAKKATTSEDDDDSRIQKCYW